MLPVTLAVATARPDIDRQAQAVLAKGVGGLVLFLVLTLLAAGASYRFFEFPMRRWIRALGQPARGIR